MPDHRATGPLSACRKAVVTFATALALSLPAGILPADLRAEEVAETTGATGSPATTVQESTSESTVTAIENAAAASAPPPDAAGSGKSRRKECQPGIGCVTNLPLPRYVSLKGDEGNVRRGPGLTHRIDWVFTRPGMPLRVTAEYENWRRIEDLEGAGGWVHYALISGVRSALVVTDMAELRASPDPEARVVAQAEAGVVARILACTPDWCRLSGGGEKGWVQKSALWGVEPGEIID